MTRSIRLNGTDFVYAVAGEDHEETVLVLHGGRGIGDHRRDFQAFLPLSDNYRVLAYDQRGCGLSGLTPPYTFDQFADDLEAFRLELCGGRKIKLIGGSFGGMIALTYAVKYGTGLSHLVLRGTAPSYHMQDDLFAHLRERLRSAPSASEAMVRKLVADGCRDDTELRLIWLACQPLYFEQFDPDHALEATLALQIHAETHRELFQHDKYYDVRADLPGIKCPTYVVVGANDWICPVNQSRTIAAGIPNAELVVVEGANHPVHIEKSALVIASIRDFFRRHP